MNGVYRALIWILIFVCLNTALAEGTGRYALLDAYSNKEALDPETELDLMTQWLEDDPEDWMINSFVGNLVYNNVIQQGGTSEEAWEHSMRYFDAVGKDFPWEQIEMGEYGALEKYDTDLENGMACYYAMQMIEDFPEAADYSCLRALELLYPRMVCLEILDSRCEELLSCAPSFVTEPPVLLFTQSELACMRDFADDTSKELSWDKQALASTLQTDGYLLSAAQALCVENWTDALAFADELYERQFSDLQIPAGLKPYFEQLGHPRIDHYMYTAEGTLLVRYSTLFLPFESLLLCQYIRLCAYVGQGNHEAAEEVLREYLLTVEWWRENTRDTLPLGTRKTALFFWRSRGLGAEMYRIAVELDLEDLTDQWYGLDGTWDEIYPEIATRKTKRKH